ncbi:MAG: DUF4097 family beta strand repeat-containing protein [Halobellus sp.]|uniref:DUF4097 family beta strand repeat-containing protein n=1 Tax=Halobellus sp. TaxID=1979212 RepID=UPI0035D44E75
MAPNTGSDSTEPSRSTGKTLSRRSLLGAAAAIGTAAVSGCTGSFVRIESTETTVERQFEASAVERLVVSDATDDVSVQRADGEVVTVRVHKRARGETSLSDLQLQSQIDSGALQIATEEPDVVGIGGGSIALEVHLPASVPVDQIRTTDGDVSVKGTAGDAVIESEDGDLTAKDVTGGVSATTQDGAISIDSAGGVVSARSRDGDLSVGGPESIRTVQTDDGDVVAEVPAVTDSATVQSSNGDIVARIGESLDATIEITTDNGEVAVADALGGLSMTSERRVEATLGEGTNDLTIHTGDGDVTVTRI